MALTLVRDYTPTTGVFEACFLDIEVDQKSRDCHIGLPFEGNFLYVWDIVRLS